MPKESQERVRSRTQALLAEMPLQELRQAYQMSQESLAKILGAKQAAISKLEHRTDMYISTLRDYIEAMGGELEIIARFPDGAIKISQFHNLGAPKAKSVKARKR
jgi:transcriptional regulator with XRE-family HTH domain